MGDCTLTLMVWAAVIGGGLLLVFIMWAGEDGAQTCGSIGLVVALVVLLICLCLFTDMGKDILNALKGG